MTSAKPWLLPDGVEEILPPQAHKLESLRRELLDLYRSWGYQLVITPLIEFLDSLLVGTSQELDLHTFRITDQLTGRMMGIRADITPQAARIDANCLHQTTPVRLCYADSVLHTRPRGLMTSRVPIRIGAELFGHQGVSCDIELVCLMLETLRLAGIADCRMVLGHVGIFRKLLAEARLDAATEQGLFAAVQRKAFDQIDAVLEAAVTDSSLRTMLSRLTRLSGDEQVLEQAKSVFAGASAAVQAALAELVTIVDGVKQRNPRAMLGFDLCELRGYTYHTGIVFAAYTPGYGRAVAKGGRYDEIGKVFGRARPASGFDSDLKTLARLSGRDFPLSPGILAPWNADRNMMHKVRALRAAGEIVIQQLDAVAMSSAECAAIHCDRRLVRRGDDWTVEVIN